MDIEVTASLFDISECGYYERGNGHHRFGTMARTLSDIDRWSRNLELAQTKLYEGSGAQDIDPVYLLAIHQVPSRDDWLVVTWNENESFDGSSASVNGSDRVGAASVDLTEIEEGRIPGYPTYFYVMPQDGKIATIRIDTRKSGRKGFQEYIKCFISGYASQVVHDRSDENSANVLGYREQPEEEPERLIPKFRLREIRIGGRLDLIRNRCHEIRSIIRKATLNIRQQADRNTWQKLMAKLGWAHSSTMQQDIEIKYEIHDAVNSEQLEAMINEWESFGRGSWDDIGVRFRGEANKDYWFSRSLARDKLNIRVNGSTTTDIDLASLALALHGKREVILGLAS